MKLYHYYRSSSSYRLRIALNLKQVAYDLESVHLVQDGGQQHQPAYKALNPQGLVPTLVVDADLVLTQSMAILDFLEQRYPAPALLPTDTRARARALQIAHLIACDIQPLNNLSVLQYLQRDLAIDDAAKSAWYCHWIQQGFVALETLLADSAGQCCVGDTVTWADICLIPQVYNAKRFAIDCQAYPIISRIDAYCQTLDAFIAAHPDRFV